jgi:chromosome segregation ATPase
MNAIDLADIGYADDDLMEPDSINKELREDTRTTGNGIKKIFDQMREQYTVLEREIMSTHSVTSPGDTSSTPTVASLTVKLGRMREELENATLRVEATEDQYRRDRYRFEMEKRQINDEYTTVCNRLLLAEGKKRFEHQVARDENFVLNVVSKFEFDEVRRQRNDWQTKYERLNAAHLVLEHKLVGTEEDLVTMTMKRDALQQELNKMQAELSSAVQLTNEQKSKLIRKNSTIY